MSTKSENVVDDWECIDDSELNTKVSQIKKNATSNQTISNVEIDCSRPFAAMLLNDDDCMRTQYVPPEPTVKILKRPTNDKSIQQSLADQKPKAPIKTLQQREQEYAEARLRILGSAKSEEDEQPQPQLEVTPGDKNGFGNSNNVNGFNGYTNNRNISNHTNSVGTSLRTYARNPQQYQCYQSSQHPYQQPAFQSQPQPQPEMRRIDDNVIRLPRGPDGTTGFMLKR